MPPPLPVVIVPPDRMTGKVYQLADNRWTPIVLNQGTALMSSWMAISRSARYVEWALKDIQENNERFQIPPFGMRTMSVQVAQIYMRLMPGQNPPNGEVNEVEVFTFYLPGQCNRAGDNVDIQ